MRKRLPKLQHILKLELRILALNREDLSQELGERNRESNTSSLTATAETAEQSLENLLDLLIGRFLVRGKLRDQVLGSLETDLILLAGEIFIDLYELGVDVVVFATAFESHLAGLRQVSMPASGGWGILQLRWSCLDGLNSSEGRSCAKLSAENSGVTALGLA
jgi:hypothetical protein